MSVDVKAQIIDRLNQIYAALSARLQALRPTTPDERAEADALADARDEVRCQLRRILDEGFAAAGADLELANHALGELTRRLDQTHQRLETTRTVLAITAEVIKVAAQVARAL